MGYLTTSIVTLALLASQAVGAPFTAPIVDASTLGPRDAGLDATLRAIPRLVEKRDMMDRLIPTSDVIELEYLDEGSLVNGNPFVATLKLGPKRPAVALEHVHSLLNNVLCSPKGILLNFISADVKKRAQDAWNMDDFMVITSHQGCNKDGERVPYMVSKVSFIEKYNWAMLYAEGISWDKASHTLDMRFGNRESHKGLDFDTYRPSKNVVVKRASATGDLSFSVVGQSIFTISGSSGSTGAQFVQKCASCVGTGTVEISSGSISLKTGIEGILGSLDGSDSMATQDLADAADIDIVFNNFQAQFEFETSIQATETFTFHFFETPVGFPGFTIPGLFSIGPAFDPTIVAQLSLFQPLSFTYGFNFSVPDGSGWNVDLVDNSKSSMLGFEGIQFDALPFTVESFTPGVNISLSFRPVISIGVNVLSIDVDPVTVFADVPKFNVGLVPLTDVDDNCAAVATPGTGANHLQVSTDFALDIGVGASVQITSGISFSPSIPLLENQIIDPTTTCLGPF